MNTAPFSVHVRTKFDGNVFVPDEPIDLPMGSTLEGNVRPPEAGSAKRPQTPEEWSGYLDGIAGSWADFDGYQDPEELPYDKEEPID